MSKVQMFSLSLVAVLAGPVHAQMCSGGNGGGMDATGNQCNTLNEVASFATGSAIAPPTQNHQNEQRSGLGSALCDSLGEDVESRFGADCQGSAGKREASGCGAVQRACEDCKDCVRIGSVLLGRRGCRNGCQRQSVLKASAAAEIGLVDQHTVH